LIEEPEEEQITLQLEPYISSEESAMAKEGEGEGEVHNLNGKSFRIGGGRRGEG